MANQPNRKRIVIVISHLVGGIRTYLLYNIPTLIKYNYRFTFIAPSSEDFDKFKKDTQAWEGTEYVDASPHNRSNGLRKVVRDYLKTNNVFLVHSQGLGSAVQVVIANFGLTTPHLSTSHGLIVDRDFPGIKGYLKLKLASMILSRVDKIITVSDDARKNHASRLRWIEKSPAKCETIFNGIDTKKFVNREPEKTKNHLKIQEGLNADTFLIGYFGRFMPEKGFLILVDALETLRKTNRGEHIQLFAYGAGDYIREYKSEAAKRKLVCNQIVFKDLISDIALALPKFDLIVVPSLWEACPLLPMEAMCAGIPVLGTNAPGLREVLSDTPSRIVSANNSDSLATGIGNALDNPWIQEAQNFTEIANSRFSVNHSVESLNRIYSNFQK